MSPIFIIIKAWIDGVLTDATEIARRLALVGKPDGEARRVVYLKSLRRLLVFTALFPIPILVFGVIQELRWLVSITGIFWALVTLTTSIVATPLGILFETLLRGPRGSGGRYVNILLWLLLIELFITLFVAVVPIHNNTAVIPATILAAATLAVLTFLGRSGEKFKKLVGTKAALLLTVFTFSFFFPQSFIALGNIRKKIDSSSAKLINSVNISGDSNKTATEKPWGRVLYCGEKMTLLDPFTRINLVVVPGGCPTDWQILPKEARGFKRISLYEGNPIEDQFVYGDRTKSKWLPLDMHGRDPIPRAKEVTGIRFRNRNPDSAKVSVELR